MAYNSIQCANEFGEDRIDMVEAGEDGDDVGARMGVFLGEEG